MFEEDEDRTDPTSFYITTIALKLASNLTSPRGYFQSADEKLGTHLLARTKQYIMFTVSR